ncbi:centrobin isoform X1 [Silurus meridionalis]|nr:centrobin isoform X1 [Silurus meridionalis]
MLNFSIDLIEVIRKCGRKISPSGWTWNYITMVTTVLPANHISVFTVTRLGGVNNQSREQEVKHHQGETHRTLTARQVSFKDTSPLVAMITDQIGDGLRLCSSSDLRISTMEEVESEPEPIAEKMELLSRTKLQEFDMAELQVSVGELEQEVQRLRAELEEKKAEVERLQTHSLDLQQQLEQHNLESKHTHAHLQQELKLLTQQLETERERVGQEVQLHEETQSRLQQLQQDLEETRRERDTARVDRALDQARFEAQRSQWDVELRLVVEQQREELVSRLQGMMRSHWAEALRLLTNQEQIEGFTHLSLQDISKPHSSLQTQDTSVCSTACTLSTAAPQAVVLQLCRDRERGIRGKGDSGGDRGRVESDFSLLNHSQTFSPLEPVLDDTHLTAGHDLWDRSVGAERHIVDNGNEGGRVQTEKERVGEMSQSGENLTLHSTHFHTQELYSDMNQNRIHSDHQVNRQQFPNSSVHPSVTLNPTLRPNQTHSSTDIRANHSSDKGAGRCNTGTRAPPTEEQTLRAPPPVSKTSSCDKRQNELQYYIAKLLERSPGEPLEEHQVELNKTRAETQSANSGVSSQVESKLEQLADLLHLTLPPTHTTQQLQQLLNTIIRSGETCSDSVRANLDRRLAQHDRREQRQAAPRNTQSTTTRGRRTGAQGQKSGSKVNAWR